MHHRRYAYFSTESLTRVKYIQRTFPRFPAETKRSSPATVASLRVQEGSWVRGLAAVVTTMRRITSGRLDSRHVHVTRCDHTNR